MMTERPEYLDLLYKIQDENKPSLAILLPGEEHIYNIDMQTRKIEAPEFLSVETDHRSEVIYFRTGRYFDSIDLTNTIAIVQYVNAAGEGRVYAVPYYDVDTLSDTNEILFPWEIDGEATKVAGDVQYSIRFFVLDSNKVDKKLIYNLSTLASTSKVLHGIKINPEELEANEDTSGKNYAATYLEQILETAQQIANKDVYWIVL
jgi:hypothetical protein